MFGLGVGELVIILLIAVLLFGNRLPGIGRSIGEGIRNFKKGLSEDPTEPRTEVPQDKSKISASGQEPHKLSHSNNNGHNHNNMNQHDVVDVENHHKE